MTNEVIQEDVILSLCNESELLAIAWKQGLGRIRRGIGRSELIALVRGEIELRTDHLATTTETRRILQAFIEKNWGVVRSQLPGCNGKCTTFPCTEGKHALCLFPNKAHLV